MVRWLLATLLSSQDLLLALRSSDPALAGRFPRAVDRVHNQIRRLPNVRFYSEFAILSAALDLGRELGP